VSFIIFNYGTYELCLHISVIIDDGTWIISVKYEQFQKKLIKNRDCINNYSFYKEIIYGAFIKKDTKHP